MNIRVRYAETDKMGFVYYGNYATYLEVGRVEALRSLGISYQNLEEQKIFLPVVHYSIDYKSPAHYDDVLTVTTIINEMPSVKITFDYEVRRGGDLLCNAKTVLVFINDQNKPMRCPSYVLEAFKPHF